MKVTMLSSTSNPLEVIYRAFRICYSKDTPTNIKLPDENKMAEFIKDKILKGHLSPLEHVSFTFAVEGISRACSHQLVRHRTFKFSQQSQRYVDAGNFDFVMPDSFKKLPEKYDGIYAEIMQELMADYQNLIELGIPKEDARYILPNATTTNIIVTCDLRNFRHFYAERSCIHAQWEIRELAELMMREVKKILPLSDHEVKKCGLTCFECLIAPN